MTAAVLISAHHLEQMAFDNDLLIEMATTEGRMYTQHRGVTFCALLGVTP